MIGYIKEKEKKIMKMVSFGVCDLESQMTCRIGVCTLKSKMACRIWDGKKRKRKNIYIYIG